MRSGEITHALPARRDGRAWMAITPGLVGLLAFLIFALQNLHVTTVRFLTTSRRVPLALALLVAAALGAVVVLCLQSLRQGRRSKQ